MKNDFLYEIFKYEKSRHRDLTLFYNARFYSLQYSNAAGNTLTVLFKPEEKKEEFYYKENSKRRGIGDKVQTLEDNGNYAEIDDLYFKMPEKFQNIASDYQYNREAIHLEKGINNNPILKETKDTEREI